MGARRLTPPRRRRTCAGMTAPDCRLYLVTPPALPDLTAFLAALEAASAGSLYVLASRWAAENWKHTQDKELEKEELEKEKKEQTKKAVKASS